MVPLVVGINFTENQSGIEVIFRYPERSGSRSISDAMTAGSIRNCSLDVTDDVHSPVLRLLEQVV